MGDKKAIGKEWGLSSPNIRWIFNQVVLPSLDSACLVWFHKLDDVDYLGALVENVQKIANLYITGGFRTTPDLTLNLLSGTLPIKIKIQDKALKTAIRLKQERNWFGNYEPKTKGHLTSHAHYVEKELEKLSVLVNCKTKYSPCDLTEYATILSKYTTSPENIGMLITENENNCLQIFTDGSVLKKGETKWAGAGFVIYRKGKNIYENHFPLGRFCTINQAEMFAILQAAEWINDTSVIKDYDLHFYSDSKTTIIKLSNNSSTNSRLTITTNRELNKLGLLNKVQVVKIKAHIGVTGNERADFLAKKGANSTIYGPEPIISFNASHIATNLRESALDKTKVCIKKQEISEANKEIQIDFLNAHKLKFVERCKSKLRTLTHLISGQNHLPSNESKRDPKIIPTCSICTKEKDNAEHFLCVCPKYALLRHKTFGEAYPTMNYLISNIHPKLIIQYAETSGKMDEEHRRHDDP